MVPQLANELEFCFMYQMKGVCHVQGVHKCALYVHECVNVKGRVIELWFPVNFAKILFSPQALATSVLLQHPLPPSQQAAPSAWRNMQKLPA